MSGTVILLDCSGSMEHIVGERRRIDMLATAVNSILPAPVGTRSIAACRVMAAVGIANRSSSFGGTGLVRPSSVSRNPTDYRASCSEISDSCLSRRSSDGCVENRRIML